MAPKVTVMKVCLSCQKCKVKLLKAIAGLEGVNKIETDDEKGTLTVTGPVDPHAVIVRARKAGKCVEIVSISDPKKPEPKDKDGDKKDCKKQECSIKPKCCEIECSKKVECSKPLCPQPCGCKMCQLKCVAIPFEMIPAPNYQEPFCGIM